MTALQVNDFRVTDLKNNDDQIQSDERSATASRARGRLNVVVPVVAMLLTLVIGSVFAYSNFGLPGLSVCLVVWFVIVFATGFSHFAGSFFNSSPELAQAQIMIGMMVRTGVPLFFALAVTQVAREWIDVGFVYYLFGFYFVGLVVDVFLILVASPLLSTQGVGERSVADGHR